MKVLPFGLIVLAAAAVCSKKHEPPRGTARADVPKGPPLPAITAPWHDDFSRSKIGGDYLATKPDAYRIVDGKLNAHGAYNHPLWLRKKLPRDVVIELDVWSNSPAGDIKVEAFGDGRTYATTRGAYTASGYVFIFGGWHNSRSILARRNEHGHHMGVDKTRRKVVPHKHYHWKIVRKGKDVDWSIDGKLFIHYHDDSPLEGDEHAYFGFNNWQSDLRFDNLQIRPAP